MGTSICACTPSGRPSLWIRSIDCSKRAQAYVRSRYKARWQLERNEMDLAQAAGLDTSTDAGRRCGYRRSSVVSYALGEATPEQEPVSRPRPVSARGADVGRAYRDADKEPRGTTHNVNASTGRHCSRSSRR